MTSAWFRTNTIVLLFHQIAKKYITVTDLLKKAKYWHFHLFHDYPGNFKLFSQARQDFNIKYLLVSCQQMIPMWSVGGAVVCNYDHGDTVPSTGDNAQLAAPRPVPDTGHWTLTCWYQSFAVTQHADVISLSLPLGSILTLRQSEDGLNVWLYLLLNVLQ